MRGSLLVRSAQVLKPHVPLIRFRKGSQEPSGDSRQTHATNTAGTGKELPKSIAIESHLIPPRFRRLSLTGNEIKIINSGGC